MKMKIFLVILFTPWFVATGWCQPKWTSTSSEFVFSDPPFKECHASTIVELTGGRLMVAWFGGDRERARNVVIWSSIREKNKWSAPVLMGDGIMNDTLRYPCWNPVLFKSASDQLFLFYKVGPSPSNWWGMVRTSADEGQNWSAPERLPGRMLGPIKNKPVQLSNGTILSPSSTEIGTWKVHLEKSTDGGKTWEFRPIDHTTKFTVIQPTFLVYPKNVVQLLCRSGNDRIVESWSHNNGETWTPLSLTKLLNPNSGIDGVTLKNGWQFLVYNPTKRGNAGRARLVAAVSRDGTNWKTVFTLENEQTGEFSYPAVIQAKDGKVHITYTYNRKSIRHVVLQQSR